MVTHVPIDDGEWHHLVTTWTSQMGVWQVFVDGVMEMGNAGFLADQHIVGKKNKYSVQ